MFKVIKDLQEYKSFMQSTYNDFGCQEDWEDFFGITLKWNEETGEVLETLKEYKGEIKQCPENFPSVIWYTNETDKDFRQGDLTIMQLDWITMEEIKQNL